MSKKIHPKHPSWEYVISMEPEKLAEVMCNLPYDELASFLDLLGCKISDDSVRDRKAGKVNLARCLRSISEDLKTAAFSTRAAWGICEPYMEPVSVVSGIRYKVKSDSLETFELAKSHLSGRVPIYVESEKRWLLSVGDIPASLIVFLEDVGNVVTVEENHND